MRLSGQRPRHLIVLGLLISVAAGIPTSQLLLAGELKVLHSFSAGSSGGAAPRAGVVVAGSSVFGTTSAGGTWDKGTVFSLNAGDGSGFTVLHSFEGGTGGAAGSNDGDFPLAPLTLVGSELWGTTYRGGKPANAVGAGTVFSLRTDGSDYKIRHLLGTRPEGTFPTAGLTLHGSKLYGSTTRGGSEFTTSGGTGWGSVYSLNTDGSNHDMLHAFLRSENDGEVPSSGSLAIDGARIYGTTAQGGTGGGPGGFGTIYSMNLDGSDHQVLHRFYSPVTGGRTPSSGLVLHNSQLYGTTLTGAPGLTDGLIYRINSDGSGYQILHEFSFHDGESPSGDLTLVGSTLYGTTRDGGLADRGILYSIELDGSNFQVLHRFQGAADGDSPLGGLAYLNGVLYGTTNAGGAFGHGTVFAFTIPEPGSLSLTVLGLTALIAASARRRLRTE